MSGVHSKCPDLILMPANTSSLIALLLQEYLDSMLELIRGLRDADRQRAVINADDESYRAAEAACGSVPFLTFGINADADVRAETLELTLWQTTVRPWPCHQQQLSPCASDVAPPPKLR